MISMTVPAKKDSYLDSIDDKLINLCIQDINAAIGIHLNTIRSVMLKQVYDLLYPILQTIRFVRMKICCTVYFCMYPIPSAAYAVVIRSLAFAGQSTVSPSRRIMTVRKALFHTFTRIRSCSFLPRKRIISPPICIFPHNGSTAIIFSC